MYYMLSHIVVIASQVPTVSCTYGDVRLVNGSDSSEGRVEICINNEWRLFQWSICTLILIVITI